MHSTMAFAKHSIIVSTITSLFLFHCASSQPMCPIEAIFQFGDSISDTGNLIRSNPVNDYAAHLPYGQTNSNKSTGRWSDGLLMIDYFAMDFKLPYLNPYLDKSASFDNGVNFAVAASTATDNWFFQSKNISVMKFTNDDTPLTLKAQLDWFRTYFYTSACQDSKSYCGRKIKQSIFILEMGSNDCGFAFLQGKSIYEVETYLPDIVGSIISATREVIRLGAVRVVVAGNFPIGCFPIYLTSFPSNDSKYYDDKGCLRDFNAFAVTFNSHLQAALAKIRPEFPDVVILYLDYYAAFQSVLLNAESYGLDSGSTLKACCGIGGSYNFDRNMVCGKPGVPICPKPESYISWDGIHPTQRAYQLMSGYLIDNTLSTLRCFPKKSIDFRQVRD